MQTDRPSTGDGECLGSSTGSSKEQQSMTCLDTQTHTQTCGDMVVQLGPHYHLALKCTVAHSGTHTYTHTHLVQALVSVRGHWAGFEPHL